MIPWQEIERARAPEGGELVLWWRDDEFVIRVDNRELMSSRARHSEEELAKQTIARLPARENQRILIGGLGMGYTTRAALDALPPDGRVIVAEIVPAVVAWNRGPIALLAGSPLSDPRTSVEVADVAKVIATATQRFDAILLDVDNGPEALTRRQNQLLYMDSGLGSCRRALHPWGILTVWSAGADPAFVRRMEKAGFDTEVVRVASRKAGVGREHSLFVGRVRKASR